MAPRDKPIFPENIYLKVIHRKIKQSIEEIRKVFILKRGDSFILT